MSRDKQIDEMARDICPLFKEYESCEQCDADLDMGGEPCIYKSMANLFADKGYRKVDNATLMGGIVEQLRAKVAEEIFAEIDKLLAVDRNGEANLDVRALQRLKKKYTEEGK